MDKNQESFLNELLNDFKVEASEHYQAIVDGLIMLEKNSDALIQKTEIEKIFREVHSLKGASRAVNLMDIEKLCMNLETVFNSLKKGDSKLIPPLFDAFHKATDLLNLLLIDVNQNIKNRGNYNLVQIIKNLEFAYRNSIQLKKENGEVSGIAQEVKFQVNEEISNNKSNESLTNIISNQKEDEIEETPITNLPETKPIETLHKENQTVRISTDKLNSLLQQSEELVSIKSTLEYYTKELQSINYKFTLWNIKANEKFAGFQKTIQEPTTHEFFASDKSFRKEHEDDLYHINKEMIQFHRITGRIIDELLHDIKTTLLFPFSSMLNIFPKIVRDLSKEYSKEIETVIIGENIEIDRRILEEIKDPMIHLIRNSIDHGIENEKERRLKGKPSKGTIEIKILQNIDRKVELRIRDDGAGLDKTKIINSAIKLGMLKPNEIEKLTDKEVYSLIFNSGISTSPFITDISGRGLGMAIVAEKVVKLGGSIELETVKDSGTTFIISLPQTLATFRGVLIKSAEQHFIIPSSAVERAIRIKYADIKTVESRKTICYKNETIALALLSDVLKITSAKKKKSSDDYLHMLILNVSQRKIAFAIDDILGEQEGIVKDLGLQLSHVTNIAGATILGNGSVVPILHPSELINSASQTNTSLDYSFDNTVSAGNAVQKSILVAEDSITIRTLLRNFIENAGFSVKTAVDGMEAYQFMQNENFDLIVSDIEMPRMNGFELTAKIRDDKKHSDLPVILVTALETADDKQRGMEAGANAYIVKSSFEKSNLIETIQRLI